MDNIIWQPTHLHQQGYGFEILLDRKFAAEMFDLTLAKEVQDRMNEIGVDWIIKPLDYKESLPYRFDGDSALVRQITVDGGRDTSLILEGIFGDRPDLSIKEPMKYTTHNVDYSSDTRGLLELFDLWVSYSGTLKEF